jgi:hypothetical protein
MTAALALLSFKLVGVLWLGAFLGALAVGGAGFAFALVASSVWLHALPPLQTAVLVLASGVCLHLFSIWLMRRTLEPARLWPFLAGGAVGIPIGISLLTRSDPGVLKHALGFFLLAYGLFALFALRLPHVAHGGRFADGMVGFFGGILGGLGGFSGVLPTIWGAAARLVEGDHPRRLPALHLPRAAHLARAPRRDRDRQRERGDVRGDDPRAVRRLLGRLADLRAPRRAPLPPGAGGAARGLGAGAGCLSLIKRAKDWLVSTCETAVLVFLARATETRIIFPRFCLL